MSEAYERNSFFVAYVKWHYGRGLRELFAVAHNFLWFIAHFFSFGLLMKTLFAPWKRLGESYEGGFNLGAYASTFVINLLMRIVGAITRTVVLLVGVSAYFFVLSTTAFALMVWILAPAVVLGGAILSVTFFTI